MLSGHVYFHSRCSMDIEDVVHSWYLAGRSLARVEYLPGESNEGMGWRDAKGFMGSAIHGCGNSSESPGPVLLSGLNEVHP